MKLDSWNTFCVAARYHNVTRSFKRSVVTTSSVLKCNKALEEEFELIYFTGIILS